jgi:thiamine monophosphate synthase
MPDLQLPALFVVTDRTLLTPQWTLAQAIAPAVTGGATGVIFRETDLPPVPRKSVASFVRDGIRGRVPLIAAGDPSFASSIGADGILVESNSVPIDAARDAVGEDGIVGVVVTTTSDPELSRASKSSFAFVNLDWENPSMALEAIRRFSSLTAVPIVVGIDPPVEACADCLRAGASGIAICRPAMEANDRTAGVRAYAEALRMRI